MAIKAVLGFFVSAAVLGIIGGIALIGRKKADVEPETEPAQSHLRISFNCLVGNLEVTTKAKKH